MSTNAERTPTRFDVEPGEDGAISEDGEGSQDGSISENGEGSGHGDTPDGGNVEALGDDAGSWRAQFEIAAMARTPREKQWTIPPQADKGPVNITLRLPEVQVDDSGGRQILIGPEQAEVLGSRLVGIRDWLQEGHNDWVGDDDPEH